MADETNRNRGNIIGAINIKLMEKNTPKTPLWTKLQIFTTDFYRSFLHSATFRIECLNRIVIYSHSVWITTDYH